MAAIGAAWWAFDADPTQGRVLLLLGAAAAVVSRVLSGRLTPRGQRVLLVIVGVLVLLTLVDAVHLVQAVNDQRASQPA